MSQYYNKIGTNEILSPSADYVGIIEDEDLRNAALRGLNGKNINEYEIDDLRQEVIGLEDEITELQMYNSTLELNIASLNDGEFFEIDNFIETFEGNDQINVTELMGVIVSLRKKFDAIEEVNFGIESPSKRKKK